MSEPKGRNREEQIEAAASR